MKAIRTLLLGTFVLLAPAAHAELVLVASPQSGIERLTQDDVVNIYLGRYRGLSSGLAAEPLDHQIDSEVRARFYRRLVGKSLAEINAYWARLVFSGKTRPPQAVVNAEGMLRIVATRPGALAYVERSQADARVKIVFELGD